MNALTRIRHTTALAALVAMTGGCDRPETSRPTTVPPPRPGTVSITPASPNAPPPVTDPSAVIALPSETVASAPVAPASVPVVSPHSDFIAAMAEQLKTIGTNIDVLIPRVNKIAPDAKVQADQDLASLRQKYEYTREQLNALKGTTGAAWDNAKDSFGHVMQTLNDAYEAVKAEFTQDGVM